VAEGDARHVDGQVGHGREIEPILDRACRLRRVTDGSRPNALTLSGLHGGVLDVPQKAPPDVSPIRPLLLKSTAPSTTVAISISSRGRSGDSSWPRAVSSLARTAQGTNHKSSIRLSIVACLCMPRLPCSSGDAQRILAPSAARDH
jgi:hypothetical protein